MSDTKLLSLRLDSKLRQGLDRLAKATNRSRSFLAAEAIRGYVALNDWQIAEIQKGIREADNRDFATDADVTKVRKKWARSGAR